VDVCATHNNDYFVVVVTNQIRSNHADITEAAWDEKVREVLQHVWDQMRDRGIVDGTMPEIIKGNPLDMLPK
jgi:NADH:ubiquinone oxidoreductase subunit B-like Fe-S oxidoreductase